MSARRDSARAGAAEGSAPQDERTPAAGVRGRGDVAALEGALAALGLFGVVEVRGSLAVLVLSPAAAQHAPTLGDGALRARAVRAAGELGFTHLALELGDARPWLGSALPESSDAPARRSAAGDARSAPPADGEGDAPRQRG